jgi:hypothetical protein
MLRLDNQQLRLNLGCRDARTARSAYRFFNPCGVIKPQVPTVKTFGIGVPINAVVAAELCCAPRVPLTLESLNSEIVGC